MSRAVTALGIRDGDVAVLRALVDRRGSAVLAYCERACPPGLVPDAAAEAFARFRAIVVASPRPSDLDPEGALLSATRHAAAERAPRASAPPSGGGLGRLRGGRPTVDQIEIVPDLLIARADGTLDAAGEEQLNRLIDGSAAARAAEERFRAAEHAYRSAPPRAIPPAVVDRIVSAMATVPAPLADANGAGTYPSPAPPVAQPAPEPEPEPVAAPAEVPLAAAAPPEPVEPMPVEPEPDPEPEPEPEPSGDDAPPPAASEPAEGADVAAVSEEPPPDEAPPPPAEDAPAPAGSVSLEAGGGEGPPNAGDEMPAGEPTIEWTLPPEDLGPEPAVEEPVAEAPEQFVAEAAAQLHRPAAPPRARGSVAASAVPPVAPAPPTAPHQHHHEHRAHDRSGLPGKAALAPAAAVIAIAAVAALAASGVFGGNDPQPPVDTGIAPKRSDVAVPDGEAGAVIDGLRQSAAEARRQRLTDSRGP